MSDLSLHPLVLMPFCQRARTKPPGAKWMLGSPISISRELIGARIIAMIFTDIVAYWLWSPASPPHPWRMPGSCFREGRWTSYPCAWLAWQMWRLKKCLETPSVPLWNTFVDIVPSSYLTIVQSWKLQRKFLGKALVTVVSTLGHSPMDKANAWKKTITTCYAASHSGAWKLQKPSFVVNSLTPRIRHFPMIRKYFNSSSKRNRS